VHITRLAGQDAVPSRAKMLLSLLNSLGPLGPVGTGSGLLNYFSFLRKQGVSSSFPRGGLATQAERCAAGKPVVPPRLATKAADRLPAPAGTHRPHEQTACIV
jgi:hypothetical protein